MGFGVAAVVAVPALVVVLGGYDVSRYTGGGGCFMTEDGGITTELGATMGLDRNLVCNGSSLSSLDGDATVSTTSGFSISLEALSCVVDSLDGSDRVGSIATLANKDSGSPCFFPFSCFIDRVGSQSLLLVSMVRSTSGFSSFDENEADCVTDANSLLPVRRMCDGGVRYCGGGNSGAALGGPGGGYIPVSLR